MATYLLYLHTLLSIPVAFIIHTVQIEQLQIEMIMMTMIDHCLINFPILLLQLWLRKIFLSVTFLALISCTTTRTMLVNTRIVSKNTIRGLMNVVEEQGDSRSGI